MFEGGMPPSRGDSGAIRPSGRIAERQRGESPYGELCERSELSSLEGGDYSVFGVGNASFSLLMIRSFVDKSPQIHPTVFVALDAQVIGEVYLGEGVSIWYGAVLRGDINYIRIGKGGNIQDGCLLHVTKRDPVTVGDEVTVGHGAILHGCRIDARSLVGMGAIILDGAQIGEGSIVAAGALVREGQSFPARSLLAGLPARVKREVTEEELREIIFSAHRYEDLARQYKGV